VANRRDSVEVSVSPYDAATVLRTAKDTIALVGSDYDVARDTLRQLASQYGVKLNIRVARDDADIAGRTYHGYVLSFNFVETSSPYRAGCDAAFLKSRALRTKTFCYQQTYALPDRLVRIRAAVPPGETVADADLSFFARNLVAAMVREH